MTSAVARPGSAPAVAASLLLGLLGAGCSSFIEVPVETPLKSKLDVGAFRRILVAGFATEPGSGDIDVVPETVRLIQNQLRNGTGLRVLGPDMPPLQEELDRAMLALGERDSLTREQREQYRLQADRILGDAEFWLKLGEEYQNPLIVTGRVDFEEQNRSGFQTQERVVRDGSGRPRLVRGNRYMERKGFALTADFHFVDGRTGLLLHKERFTEEVLYGADQQISPLSCYFELMDRLLPNLLGVISPQKIRGTRILLR